MQMPPQMQLGQSLHEMVVDAYDTVVAQSIQGDTEMHRAIKRRVYRRTIIDIATRDLASLDPNIPMHPDAICDVILGIFSRAGLA